MRRSCTYYKKEAWTNRASHIWLIKHAHLYVCEDDINSLVDSLAIFIF